MKKKKNSQIVPKKISGRNLRGTVPQATWPLKYSFFQWPHASKKIFWVFHSDRKTSHKQTASSVLLLQSFVFTCFRHKPFLKIIKPLFQKKKLSNPDCVSSGYLHKKERDDRFISCFLSKVVFLRQTFQISKKKVFFFFNCFQEK